MPRSASSRLSALIELRGLLAPDPCLACSQSFRPCYISSDSICCSFCVQRCRPCSLSSDLARIGSLLELRQLDSQIASLEISISDHLSDFSRLQTQLAALFHELRELRLARPSYVAASAIECVFPFLCLCSLLICLAYLSTS
jgi:hypothetical protein